MGYLHCRPGIKLLHKKETHTFFTKPAKAKNSEFCIENATSEERKGFEASDKDERSSIIGMKAVRILSEDEASEVKKKFPHRIISSRMIRRKKPTPGVGCFKHKSRWRLHGHQQDPDTGTFKVFSPTPCTEAITLFFQACLNESLIAPFLDVKNAFCQSRRLARRNEKIYATPCERTGLDPSQLLEILVPVYGLDDAPLRWHQTLLEFFQELGFERTLLDPCWLVKRDAQRRIVGQALIEVDDLNFGLKESYVPELRKALEKRFTFGKWEEGEADFAVRHVKVEPTKVVMHQEKYILEKIQPIPLPRGKSGRQIPARSLLTNLRFSDPSCTRSTGWHIRPDQKCLASSASWRQDFIKPLYMTYAVSRPPPISEPQHVSH